MLELTESIPPTQEGEFVRFPDSPFELFQPYPPAGDQPEAIAKLVEGLRDGEAFQTLLVEMLQENNINFVHVQEPDYDGRFLRCVELVKELMGEQR